MPKAVHSAIRVTNVPGGGGGGESNRQRIRSPCSGGGSFGGCPALCWVLSPDTLFPRHGSPPLAANDDCGEIIPHPEKFVIAARQRAFRHFLCPGSIIIIKTHGCAVRCAGISPNTLTTFTFTTLKECRQAEGRRGFFGRVVAIIRTNAATMRGD